MTATLAAVIVNYNSGAQLRAALQSIAEDVRDTFEAIVVDNASTDGSEAAALEFGPQVRLLRNQQNVGFACGVNQAIAVSSAPAILIMNPDCRLLPGAVAQLWAALAADAACAIAAPRVLDPDGSTQGNARGDPTMLTGLFGRTGTLRRALPWLSVSRRNVIDDTPGAGASVPVDWVSGACMLARRAPLVEVGLFDERYFMYWEDADICRRLRRLGYTIRHVPGASAVHVVGESSRTARVPSIRAFHASAYLYYATHVAPGVLNPKRWLARLLLGMRCWMKIRNEKFKMQNANRASMAI